MKLEVSKSAEIDIDRAISWYNEEEKGLGRSFLMTVNKAFEFIKENPYANPLVVFGVLRQYVLNKFPYYIYYSVQVDTILILGVIHQRIDPLTKYSRLQGS